MTLHNVFSMLTVIALFVACSLPIEQKDVLGTYVVQGYVNTNDTIILRSSGTYERHVYDAAGNLALTVNNRWELRNQGELILHAFFLNLDRDLAKFPELTSDPGYQINTYFDRSSGAWEFCTGDDEAKCCYRRLQD